MIIAWGIFITSVWIFCGAVVDLATKPKDPTRDGGVVGAFFLFGFIALGSAQYIWG